MKPYSLPKYIKALAKCGDLDSSRYALGGVCMERDKFCTHLIATDGRKLVLVSDMGEHAGTGSSRDYTTGTVIPGKALTQVGKTMQARVELDEPTDSEGRGTVTCNKIKLTTNKKDGNWSEQKLERIEGRFPRWRDVVVERENVEQIQLNPKLLREICDVFIDAGVKDGFTLAVPTGDDQGSAVSFVAKDDQGRYIQAILMPMSADDYERVRTPGALQPQEDSKSHTECSREDKPSLEEQGIVVKEIYTKAEQPIDPPTQDELDEDDAEDQDKNIAGVPELMSSKALAAAIT